jgi:hypothetical protein
MSVFKITLSTLASIVCSRCHRSHRDNKEVSTVAYGKDFQSQVEDTQRKLATATSKKC